MAPELLRREVIHGRLKLKNDNRMDPNKKKHQKDETLEGRYANIFEVGHNAVEFLIDFGQYHPGNCEKYFMRIITCPKYAKELLGILQWAIGAYESKYGLIDDETD